MFGGKSFACCQAGVFADGGEYVVVVVGLSFGVWARRGHFGERWIEGGAFCYLVGAGLWLGVGVRCWAGRER